MGVEALATYQTIWFAQEIGITSLVFKGDLEKIIKAQNGGDFQRIVY